MNSTVLNWEKINPADIDLIAGVKSFAFVRNGERLHTVKCQEGCLFSQLLVEAVQNCLSIYSTEVWVGIEPIETKLCVKASNKQQMVAKQ